MSEAKLSLHLQASIFGTLSAILHLGNMEISDDQDGNAKLLDDQHMKV